MKRGILKKSLVYTAMFSLVAGAIPQVASAAEPTNDGYRLVWSDEFDGSSLNTADWNVEQHEPGWVNAELQRYTGLDEGNIEVKDGNLVIKPHVTEPEENPEEQSEEPSEVKETDVDFTVDYGADTSETIAIQVNFGHIGDGFEAASGAANVTISEVSLKDITDEENPVDLISSFDGSWIGGVTSPAAGTFTFNNGMAFLTIENAGEANWSSAPLILRIHMHGTAEPRLSLREALPVEAHLQEAEKERSLPDV